MRSCNCVCSRLVRMLCCCLYLCMDRPPSHARGYRAAGLSLVGNYVPSPAMGRQRWFPFCQSRSHCPAQMRTIPWAKVHRLPAELVLALQGWHKALSWVSVSLLKDKMRDLHVISWMSSDSQSVTQSLSCMSKCITKLRTTCLSPHYNSLIHKS